MKISLEKILIVFAYIFSYVLAIAQLRYQLYQHLGWFIIYRYSVYILIGVSICAIIINLKIKRISKLSVFLIMLISYELFITFACGVDGHTRDIITDILPWPLLWMIFYDYSRKNDIPKSFYVVTVLGLIVCCILSVPNIQRHLVDYGRRGSVIFPIYFTFSFYTILLLLDINKKVKVAFGVIVVMLLLFSTKRAGVAAVILGLTFYYVVQAHIASTLREKLKRYGVYLFLGVAAFLIGSYVINKYEISIIDRFNDISTDGGSNRVFIWLDVMNHFDASNILEKIFGHGFHAVFYKVQPYGYQRMAHNSFLETLYDYGIVGLVFLFVLIFKLFKYFFEMIKSKYKYAPAMAYSIVPLLFLSLFSYFFEQTVVIVPYAIAWGIMMGQFDSDRKGLYKD